MHRTSHAFTLLEVMLSTVMAMMISGLAIVVVMAAIGTITAIERVGAKNQALRGAIFDGIQHSRLAGTAVARPVARRMLAANAVIDQAAQVPAVPASVLPTITYGTVVPSSLVAFSVIVDPLTVRSIDPVALAPALNDPNKYGNLAGKSYRTLQLSGEISLNQGDPVGVMSLPSNWVSLSSAQPFLMAWSSRSVYLLENPVLANAYAGQPASLSGLVFGQAIRFVVPVL